MPQATCRIPAVLDQALEEAEAEAGVFRSDLIRRALVLYMTSNPDEFYSFAHRDLPPQYVGTVDTGTQSESSEDSPTYDPTEGFE